jgi:hypothetical protein
MEETTMTDQKEIQHNGFMTALHALEAIKEGREVDPVIEQEIMFLINGK